MKSFNEIMKIRDEPESKDIPVEKRKFQIKKSDDEKMQAYVMEVMGKCGLAPYMIHRYPHQFSGGQRQMTSSNQRNWNRRHTNLLIFTGKVERCI